MRDTSAKKNRYIAYLIRFGVAGGAIYLALRGEDIRAILVALTELNVLVFGGALGLYVVAQFVFVFRWRLLMRVLDIRIGFLAALRLHFLGLFYNHCLPSSVGGDLLRAWYVTKHTEKRLEAALSVFVDRVVGLVGMLIMAFFCYWFVPAKGRKGRFGFPYKIDSLRGLLEYKWVLVGIGGVFVLVILGILSTARGRAVLRGLISTIRIHAAVGFLRCRVAGRAYYNSKFVVVSALFLTFFLQGVCVLAMWLIGRQIGITAAGKYYFIFFPISWLLGALPISVGGAGVMELWLKDIFIRVCGVSSEKAVVLAFSQRVLWLFGSVPGAVIHLLGAHLPKEFSIDYEKLKE